MSSLYRYGAPNYYFIKLNFVSTLLYFSPRPKEKKADLFGRDHQLTKLESYIKNRRPLIIVRGLRRTGKTSLVKTSLNENAPKNHILIDLRGLGSKGSVSTEQVYNRTIISINNFLSKNESKIDKIKQYLKRINGINMMGNGISLSDKNPNLQDLASIFEKLDEWVTGEKEFPSLVLAIDEAQIFNDLSDSDMASILASVYDNCKNIVIILSGSQIGLLDKFVGKMESNSGARKRSHALRGFHKDIVELPHLKPSQSKKYLEDGFQQLSWYTKGADSDKIISKVQENFDGIIGWLNNFGVLCESNGTISESFISDVQTEGLLTVQEEFDNFETRGNDAIHFKKFMEALAIKSLNLNEIEDIFKKETKKVPITKLKTMGDDLIDQGFVGFDSNTDKYSIPDPLHCKYFLRK